MSSRRGMGVSVPMCYLSRMDFVDFMFWKAVAIVALVFFVSMIYTAVTGRSIEQARRDRSEAADDQPR